VSFRFDRILIVGRRYYPIEEHQMAEKENMLSLVESYSHANLKLMAKVSITNWRTQ
jgi:hypothetical protein